MLSQEQKEALITAAIMAPSADNSQPFQYQWQKNNDLALYIDKSRSGKSSDNRYVLSDIALGAVIENIHIKAAQRQLTTLITYFPDPDSDLHVANISFSASANTEVHSANLANQIPIRHTNRTFPFKGDVTVSDQEEMTIAASLYESGLNWYQDKKEIKNVLPVIQKAESIRFKSKQLHQELFSTVHFGNPDAEEGMHIDVLAIEKPAQPFFKLMKKWSFMNVVNKLGAYALLGIRSVKIPILLSPALALITIKNNDRVSVINGGRAFQRFWLQATKSGYAVQPYAAPGIFSLGYVSHENHLDKDFKRVQAMMSKIVVDGYGLMFVRIGRSNKVIVKSNRRKAKSFSYE